MLIFSALAVVFAAGPVVIDPAALPERVGANARGAPIYRFGPDANWPVSAAVVLTLESPTFAPPGAQHLGGPFWRVPADSGDAAVLRAAGWLGQPGVRDAFPDVLLPITTQDEAPLFDDPEYGGQWYLQDLDMEPLLALSTGDAAIRVAVIDSGIDVDHIDLAGGVVGGIDTFAEDEDPRPDPGEFCGSSSSQICDEHGTAVSGIIGARANNGVGIVGLCADCSLIAIKLLGEGAGSGSLSASIQAFEYAIAQDADVINNSWGYTTATTTPGPLAEAITRAATVPNEGRGALVVFAAGNDDRAVEDGELCALPEVLCVSGIDTYGNVVNYSNFGAAIDLAAPSATVSLAPEDGLTETFGGTSAAAPVVSGFAAWTLSYAPELTAAELGALLVDTARQSPLSNPGEDGHDDRYGWGVLSPAEVYAALAPEEEPDPLPPGGCGCGSGGAPNAAAALLLLALSRRRR